VFLLWSGVMADCRCCGWWLWLLSLLRSVVLACCHCCGRWLWLVVAAVVGGSGMLSMRSVVLAVVSVSSVVLAFVFAASVVLAFVAAAVGGLLSLDVVVAVGRFLLAIAVVDATVVGLFVLLLFWLLVDCCCCGCCSCCCGHWFLLLLRSMVLAVVAAAVVGSHCYLSIMLPFDFRIKF